MSPTDERCVFLESPLRSIAFVGTWHLDPLVSLELKGWPALILSVESEDLELKSGIFGRVCDREAHANGIAVKYFLVCLDCNFVLCLKGEGVDAYQKQGNEEGFHVSTRFNL